MEAIDRPASNLVLLNRISTVLAFGGIFVAGYLSLAHMMHKLVPCGPNMGCSVVTQHPSGNWFGVPVAYVGLVAYIVLAALGAIRAISEPPTVRKAVLLGLLISGIGLAGSAYLQYVSLVQIKEACPWCIASAAIMLLIFLAHVGMALSPAVSTFNSDVDFKIMVGSGLATFVALVALSGYLQPTQPEFTDPDLVRGLTEEQLVPEGAHILGSEDAPVTIVEWADLVCGYCRQNFPKMHQIVNGSNGKIRLVFRHLPLYTMKDHEVALPAAVIAEIASEKDKFWDFIEGMYSFQQPPNEATVLAMARSLGLDTNELNKRRGDPQDSTLKAVQRDLATANSFVKERFTPIFVVYIRGEEKRWVAKTMEELYAILARDEVARRISGSGPSN